MKYTNKYNLPQPIVEAIKNSGYSKGASDITATGLIEPVQIRILKERYSDKLQEDASDNIYILQGQSIHTILERAASALEKDGYVAERRFYLKVGDCLLGAQIDLFHQPTGVLQDYKITSVYSVKDGPKEEYVKQLNIGRYLLKHGYELVDGKSVYRKYDVTALQIVAILRDWRKGEAQKDNHYPEHQVAVLDVPLIPDEEVSEYIAQQIEEHRVSKQLPDNQLPPCSAADRWERPGVYAIMKRGQKRAARLCDTEEGAKLALEALGAGHEIVFRPGISTRCENYCQVKSFCSQYKKMKETNE